MEFETELAKKLQAEFPESGSIKQLQNAIKQVKNQINLHLLDDPSEETTKVKNELQRLLTLFQNKLSTKLKTVPSGSKGKPSAHRKGSKKSFGSLLRTRLTVEQHRIRELTEQARCDLQVRGLPKNVVNSICDYIRQAPAASRIAPLYLIDSIVKNIGSVYVDLFEEQVEGILVSTFKHGEKKARDTVVKILKEWHRRKLFKKEIRKKIYDQLVTLGGNAAPGRPSRPPTQSSYPPARGSKPLLTHPQRPQRPPRSQPYSYQPPSKPTFNIEAALQRFQYDVQTRPDLRPHLDQIHMKLSMNQDITTDIIHFQQLINMPPATDLHQRVQLSQVLTDLEGHISKKAKANKKRKRATDSRVQFPNRSPNPSNTKRRRRDESGFWFFDKGDLKKLHKRSLELLYPKKLQQCHICALRLQQNQMDAHLTQHYKEQVKLREKSQNRTRTWNVKDWVMDVNHEAEQEKPMQTTGRKQVLIDENFTTCKICENPLDKLFDETHKEWFNVGCVYENGKTVTNRSKPIVHWLCYTKQQQQLKEKSAAKKAPLKLPDIPMPVDDGTGSAIMGDDSSSSEEEESSDEGDSGTEIILFSDDEEEEPVSSQQTESANPMSDVNVKETEENINLPFTKVEKTEVKKESKPELEPLDANVEVKKETKAIETKPEARLEPACMPELEDPAATDVHMTDPEKGDESAMEVEAENMAVETENETINTSPIVVAKDIVATDMA